MAQVAHLAVALLAFGTCALALRKQHANRRQTLSRECAPKWSQCGGTYFSGATSCCAGSTCVWHDEWYSKCEESASPSPSPSPSPTTTSPLPSPIPEPTPSPSPTTTSPLPGPIPEPTPGAVASINPPSRGAWDTGIYRNLFVESGKHTIEDVQTKLDSVFNQLFYGNDVDERLFYWADGGTSEAYIWSVDSNDVRSEGMSYGMMIAVQLDRRTEFDGLWRWAKKNMQHNDGSARDGYFAWKCRTDGSKMDHNTASDGEEWFVTALFFAADRWGSNSEFDYAAEANRILYASTHKSNTQSVTNLFSAEEKMVVFTPYGHSATFTDASYHLPTFYRVWAKLANESNAFYASMADESRVYFQKSAHPSTGLMSDYSEFDGTLTSGGQNFAYDAWRAGTNVATDYAWFGDNAGTWAKTHADTLLRFFHGQGVDSYVDQFKLDGTPAGYDHSAGLVAMNAVVALAATDDIAWEFVEAFWNLPVPTGKFRYYNGMLYMWGFLHVSGNFKAWVNTSATD